MAWNHGRAVGSGLATGALATTAALPFVGPFAPLVGGAAGLLHSGADYLSQYMEGAGNASPQNGQAGTQGVQQSSRYSPQQNAAINQLLPGTVQGMQSNQFDFAPIEKQAREGFASKTLPGIANKFIHSDNKTNSSSLNAALGNAGRGLENDLSAQRQDYNLKQQQIQNQRLGLLLNPAQENRFNPQERSPWSQIASEIPGLAGAALQGYEAYQGSQAQKQNASQGQKTGTPGVEDQVSPKQPNALQTTQHPLAQPISQPNVAAQPQANPFNRFQTQVAGLTPSNYPSIAPASTGRTYPGSNTPSMIGTLPSPAYARSLLNF